MHCERVNDIYVVCAHFESCGVQNSSAKTGSAHMPSILRKKVAVFTAEGFAKLQAEELQLLSEFVAILTAAERYFGCCAPSF